MSIVSVLSNTAKTYILDDYVIWPLYYLIITLAVLHFIYITTIKFVKIYHMIKVLHNGKLEVRNSPIDRLATSAAKLFQFMKIGCEMGAAGFGLVCTALMFDQILEIGDRKKVLTPLIKRGVNLYTWGQPVSEADVVDTVTKELKDLESTKKQIDAVHKSLKELENTTEESSLFTKSEIDSMKRGFNDLRHADQTKLQDAANKIKHRIDEINRRGYCTYRTWLC